MQASGGRRWRFLWLGLLLTACGLALALYAGRAAVSQRLYYQLRYGAPPEGDVAWAQARAVTAQGWYTHNYRLAAWMGRLAFDRRHLEGEGERMLALARWWCDQGLRAQPWLGALVHLDTELLALRSTAEAIKRWEAYVDWQFWEPHHHAYLIYLYARDGRLEQATEALRWLRKTPYERWARQQVRQAWSREQESMRDLAVP